MRMACHRDDGTHHYHSDLVRPLYGPLAEYFENAGAHEVAEQMHEARETCPTDENNLPNSDPGDGVIEKVFWMHGPRLKSGLVCHGVCLIHVVKSEVRCCLPRIAVRSREDDVAIGTRYCSLPSRLRQRFCNLQILTLSL